MCVDFTVRRKSSQLFLFNYKTMSKTQVKFSSEEVTCAHIPFLETYTNHNLLNSNDLHLLLFLISGVKCPQGDCASGHSADGDFLEVSTVFIVLAGDTNNSSTVATQAENIHTNTHRKDASALLPQLCHL